MPLAIRKCALLPVWLAMIAAQPSVGNAETEPRRLASPRTCVNLLPPETIEPETPSPEAILPFSEWPGAVNRLAQRERPVAGQADDSGSFVPFRLSSRFDQTQAGLVLVCAGVAAGGLCLALAHRRPSSRKASDATSRSERADVDWLKPLIANALPIVEETLRLPRLARLHGRPVANERYRLDAAQPLGEPHFAGAPATAPIEADVVHWVSAAEPGVKKPSYRRYGPSSLERALATVEGDDR